MAVGDEQAPKKHAISIPKIIFLLIMVFIVNHIHFKIQLKVELKNLIFIYKLN